MYILLSNKINRNYVNIKYTHILNITQIKYNITSFKTKKNFISCSMEERYRQKFVEFKVPNKKVAASMSC